MACPQNVRPHTKQVFDEVLAWQKSLKVSRIPSHHSDDETEARLGSKLAKLLLRRTKPLGSKPSGGLMTGKFKDQGVQAQTCEQKLE